MDIDVDAMIDLGEWANLGDLCPQPLLNVDLFPYDLCGSIEDCDVRFDIPLPPPTSWCLPHSPEIDDAIDYWGGNGADVAATHPDEVSSYMFEQIFFGRDVGTGEQGTPFSTAPSSSESEDDMFRSSVGRDGQRIATVTPREEDNTTVASTTPPLSPPKRLFALPDIDFSANVGDVLCQSTPFFGYQQGPADKKAKIAFKRAPMEMTNHGNCNGSFTGSTDDDPSEGDGTGAIHNILERKRRDDLRASFDGLRVMVPGLRADSRTPKVSILQGARQHIKQLEACQRDLRHQHQALLDSRAALRARLCHLQSTAK